MSFRALRSVLCPGKTWPALESQTLFDSSLWCRQSVLCQSLVTYGDNTHPMKFLEANEGRSGKHLMSPHTRAVHHGFQTGCFRPGVGRLTVNEQKIQFLLLLQKSIQQKVSIRKCAWPNFYIALKRALREDTEAWMSLVYILVLLFILSGSFYGDDTLSSYYHHSNVALSPTGCSFHRLIHHNIHKGLKSQYSLDIAATI